MYAGIPYPNYAYVPIVGSLSLCAYSLALANLNRSSGWLLVDFFSK